MLYAPTTMIAQAYCRHIEPDFRNQAIVVKHNILCSCMGI
jgi:hypothetical protein